MTVTKLIYDLAIHYPTEIAYYVRRMEKGWICIAGVEKGYEVFAKKLEGSLQHPTAEEALSAMEELVSDAVQMINGTDAEMYELLQGKIKAIPA